MNIARRCILAAGFGSWSLKRAQRYASPPLRFDAFAPIRVFPEMCPTPPPALLERAPNAANFATGLLGFALDFAGTQSVHPWVIREDAETHGKPADQPAFAPLLALITKRFSQARDLGAAAEAYANTGNSEGAFRMLFDIEQPMREATSLLNTACIARRENAD